MSAPAYDPVPPKAGHVVVGAAWKWDGRRYRLQQVIYEPKKQAERRQGMLI